MTQLYFSVYFLTTLCLVLFNLRFLLNDFTSFNKDLNVYVLNIFYLMPYVLIILCLLGLIGKRLKPILFATVAFLCFVVFVPFVFSGKVNHSMHAYLYGSFCLLFFDFKNQFSFSKNNLVLLIAQSLILSTYFNAGINKVINFIKADSSFVDFINSPLQHIAYSFAEGNDPHPVFLGFMNQPIVPSLIAIGFALIIFFELFAVVVVFKNELMKVYGLAIIAFHLVCSIALGIWFSQAILASAFFLVFTEIFIEKINEQQP